MKVAYEITILAWGQTRAAARAGVFRAVENVALGLSRVPDCELTLCVAESLELLSMGFDYLRESELFSGVSLCYPRLAGELYHALRTQVRIMSTTLSPGLPTRALRRVLNEARRFLGARWSALEMSQLRDVDVFHSPYRPLSTSLRQFPHLRRFLTVYDLIAIHSPQLMESQDDRLSQQILDSIDPESWVLTISRATKNDLCNYLPLDPARVFVTYLAAAPEYFYPSRDETRFAAVRVKYGLPDAPYFLCLNTLEPRKNLERVIRAFAGLASQERIKDAYLVLAGARGWSYQEIFRTIERSGVVKDRILVTGYVANEDLAALYSGALAFVYPSLYEGFGLPPLEAMQCGLPVIASNTSALPEVVGDAGIMVNPYDEDALCQAMFEIYNDSTLRKFLAAKGLARAKHFSWDNCTRATLDAYKVALAS